MTESTWQAFVCERNGFVITGEEDVAEALQGRDAQISIRRCTALPFDRHNDGLLHMPGTWCTNDLFMEIDIDDIDEGCADEFWQLTKAAAAGMSEAARKAVTPVDDEARTWLIWSHRHKLWWRPNRAGYTGHAHLAGVYTRAEVDGICDPSSESIGVECAGISTLYAAAAIEADLAAYIVGVSR
ncbi:hypothetical protein Rhe02_55480 [Rhizocola hellebori]|uniref:Uncharacterized protein n=1 Tax=Rhizocola hellebori TaxID=1392758 RepID=A0A8J3VIW2_9ACTN|nr:hypothetical protein [Rhizocola hellebori]GIH07481.1 hypothetical protein Rhe02_55480 [Rhizocola hellebori]